MCEIPYAILSDSFWFGCSFNYTNLFNSNLERADMRSC